MRNGEKVWYCERISKDGEKLEVFGKPQELILALHHLTIQPASGYDMVEEFGEMTSKTWNAIGQPYGKWMHLKEGDRFYVDGARPYIPEDGEEPEDGWGYDANARIYSVRPQNLAVRFILQKIE